MVAKLRSISGASQLLEIAVGNVVTTPIRYGIKLDAMRKFHGFTSLNFPEFMVSRLPQSMLLVFFNDGSTLIGEGFELYRIANASRRPSSVPQYNSQLGGIISLSYKSSLSATIESEGGFAILLLGEKVPRINVLSG